ncbi:MAG TPA: DoxX family protein [Pseudolabrys sp.]|nr:DoxX family protein [Pseudolabrys sp.]
MSDQVATAPASEGQAPGAASMSSLAERLTALAPAPSLDPSADAHEAQFTHVENAAAPQTPVRRRRSLIGALVAGFVAACSFIPYSLVALALRLVMARLLFLDGQARIDGPSVPVNFHDFSFSFVLPQQIRAETLTGLLNQGTPLPLPPTLAAYLVCYGEFVLPILLVVGLATRFSALALMVATVLIQVYVMPEALWTAHVYWAAIALVLLSQGPGKISLDHVIRLVARR